MAFWNKETYAKVWKIETKEKYTDIRISTSEKDNREEGKYINSNWFARCVGKANNQITKINEGDRIKITSSKISNESYEDKNDGSKKSALKVIIFEFETLDSGNTKSDTKAKSEGKASEKKSKEKEVDDEELPF